MCLTYQLCYKMSWTPRPLQDFNWGWTLPIKSRHCYISSIFPKKQGISISMCQISEWTSHLLPCQGILHICITWIFEEWLRLQSPSKKNYIKPLCNEEAKSAKTRSQGFTSSLFSFSLLCIQCLLNSLFLILSVASSPIGCSSILASLTESSFIFVGWRNYN